MTAPYREPASVAAQPTKIVAIATSKDRLYGLDADGVVWVAFEAKEYFHDGWHYPNRPNRPWVRAVSPEPVTWTKKEEEEEE
jgi:hypothetical protein